MTGPIQKVDYATGEIMCLVEVPATYKTVTKTVLKTPATTRKVEIPAEYTTVRKQVMKTPSTTREVTVPAEYKTVEIQKLVSPAEEKRVQIPAEQQSVTKTVVASEGRIEWQSVLCETNASPELIKSMQLSPAPGRALFGQDRWQAKRQNDGRRPLFPAG